MSDSVELAGNQKAYLRLESSQRRDSKGDRTQLLGMLGGARKSRLAMVVLLLE
jgi:hypothetical protein